MARRPASSSPAPARLKAAGSTYLAVGIAFLGVAASGQVAFLGVGLGLIGVGIALLARSRKDAARRSLP